MINFNKWLSLKEVSQTYVDEIKDELEDLDDVNNLSFGNLFGDKTRIVIPFITEEHRQLKDLIESIKNPKSGIPYKVDLENSIVISTDSNGKESKIKLGSFIHSKFKNEEWSKWWDKKGGNFSLLISRHPIDVLKMSDFKNIQSCHSEGGLYFDCAVKEAQGNAPIAYVVKTQDIKSIPNLQTGEIFEDPQRGIKGITPVARLRLRRYHHLESEHELAIPDLRVYGEQTFKKDLIKNLTDWSKKEQQEILNKLKNPQAKDFQRRGGHYMDHSDGELFTNFFGVRDYTKATHETEQDQEDIWRKECLEITREYRNRIQHSKFDFDITEDEPNMYQVYFYGYMEITIPELKHDKDKSYEIYDDLIETLEETFDEENVEVEVKPNPINNIIFKFNLKEQKYNEHGPDDYREFLRNLEKTLDDKYEEIKERIYYFLEEYEFLDHSPLQQTETWDEKTFQNFEWENTENYGYDIYITSKPIVLKESELTFEEYRKLLSKKNTIAEFMEKSIKNYIISLDKKKYLNYSNDYLPGMQPRFNPLIKSKTITPTVSLDFISINKDDKFYPTVVLNFRFNRKNHDLFEDTLRLINFLDQKVILSNEIYVRVVKIFTAASNLITKTNINPNIKIKNEEEIKKAAKYFRNLIKNLYELDPENHENNKYLFTQNKVEKLYDPNVSDSDFYNNVTSFGNFSEPNRTYITKLNSIYFDLKNAQNILGKKLYQKYYNTYRYNFLDIIKRILGDKNLIDLQNKFLDKYGQIDLNTKGAYDLNYLKSKVKE